MKEYIQKLNCYRSELNAMYKFLADRPYKQIDYSISWTMDDIESAIGNIDEALKSLNTAHERESI